MSLKGPKNPQNQEIFDLLLQKIQAGSRRFGHQSGIKAYEKAIKSLQKYPLPIITAEQAQRLTGIGPKIGQSVTQIIKEKYKKHLRMDSEYSLKLKLREQTIANSQRKCSRSKSKKKEKSQSKKNPINSYFKEKNPPLTPIDLISVNSDNDSSRGLLDSFSQNYSQTFSNTSISKFKMSQKKREFESIDKNCSIQPLQYPSNPVKTSKIKKLQLILKVDTREKRKMGEKQNFFLKTLKDYKLECDLCSLSIGDFMWTIQVELESGKRMECVTDYIIERKIKDDLVGSVIDGRYTDQKNRLKRSGLKEIFYIVEGQLSGGNRLKTKSVESAISQTRSFNRFKVIETEDFNHTVSVISKIDLKIRKIYSQKIKRQDILKLGPVYKLFSDLQKPSKNLKICQFFSRSLACIDGFGKKTVAYILTHFETLNEFYLFLREGSEEEKKIFFDRFTEKQKNALIKEFYSSNDTGDLEMSQGEINSPKRVILQKLKRRITEEKYRSQSPSNLDKFDSLLNEFGII